MTSTQKRTSNTLPRKPGRPKHVQDAPSVNTAHHIMVQAKQLFMHKSFSAVSINDIVMAAEISKPTLYYYFPDKEHLYAAVLIELIEKAGSFFQDVLQSEQPLREKLIQTAEGFFEYAPTSVPCLLRDVAQHLNRNSAEQVLITYEKIIQKPFEQLFQESIATGHLKTTNPRLLAELFLTLLDWLTLRFTYQQDPPLENREKAIQVVNLFLNGAAV